jgi:hypothetical protein
VFFIYVTKWHNLTHAPRVFKTRQFAKWMRKTDLTDEALCLAVSEMVGGLVDADLGGDVLKKRVALPGRGKRGGARTLVATRRASRWFFVFGFEKNEKANVTSTELEALQWLAKQLLDLTGRQLEVAAQDGSLVVPAKPLKPA